MPDCDAVTVRKFLLAELRETCEIYGQSSTSPPVTKDCDTSENCLVILFTKGSAVPLLM